ncbi:MAG: HAD-IA family hydrolase [Desulfobacterales bacterium]|nr:HAD-IA family hydrolase [Desulfobacterales bacterium]
MKWEAVFFDFDGVILDSCGVKTKAFANMFQKYGPEVEKKVIEYHLANGGLSRFNKFKYYYEKILNKPINEEIIECLSQQFSNFVVNDVLTSPFIPGAKESLEVVKKNNVSAYIISGTPDSEIKLIVKKKELKNYFKEVHGSPKKKWEICQKIINKENYKPQNCLFIGDAMADYEAACKNGICFLGIVRNNEISIFPNGTPISDIVTLKIPASNLK